MHALQQEQLRRDDPRTQLTADLTSLQIEVAALQHSGDYAVPLSRIIITAANALFSDADVREDRLVEMGARYSAAAREQRRVAAGILCRATDFARKIGR